MFWKFNLLTTHIDTLLDNQDVTLKEILDEDDVLQECKAQNRRLVDFLIKKENMEELVNLITQEPSDDTEEKVRYKHPNTACELLTSDVMQITEMLSSEESLMAKVYGFLEADEPLNPLLASFFSKVMGLLITRKSEMMLELLQSKTNFVGQLLHHLGTSAIMDLLLRLITCIESPEIRTNCITWLNEQNLVQRLVAMIDPSESEEKHCNASQSLCDIIRLSREQMSQLQEKAESDPLLSAIESQETVTQLLNHMFNGEKNESVLVNGLLVIQTLLEFRKIGLEGTPEQMTALDAERLAQGVSCTLQALTPRLVDFHQLLLEPPTQHYSLMPTTAGNLDPPLGNTRLQIARLVAMIVITNTHTVNLELASLKTTQVLLELCFKYGWNNFLHTQVEQCLSTILSNAASGEDDTTDDNPLLYQLLVETKLVDRILTAWEDNEQQQSRPTGHRQGYMGHLTKIANHVVYNLDKGNNSEKIKQYLEELPESIQEKWKTFTNGALNERNVQNTVELVSNQSLNLSSDDDDPDFSNIPFPQDTAMQQFGFNEEEFAEQEEQGEAPFTSKISSINIDISAADESNTSSSLFEQACNERMQQFDEADSDEDLWEEKELTFAPSSSTPQNTSTAPEQRRASSKDSEEEDSEGSSDSEEDLDSPRVIRQAPATSSSEKMEVDQSENWANFDDMNLENPGAAVAMDAASPWEPPTSQADNKPETTTTTADSPMASTGTSDENWASFGDMEPGISSSSGDGDSSRGGGDGEPTRDSLSITDPGPRSSSPVAMETTDSLPSNSRTAAYLVSSAPADLAEEITEAGSSTVSSSNSDTSEATQYLPSRMEEEGAEAEPIAVQPDQAPVTPDQSEAMSPSSASAAECTSSSPSSSQESPSTPRCPAPDSSNGVVSQTSQHNSTDSFLASSGLMKSPADTGSVDESRTSEAEPQQSAADSSESPKSKLEEERAQAQAALEQYSSAVNPGGATSDGGGATENGPF